MPKTATAGKRAPLSFRQALLLPYYLATVVTSAKSFHNNPVIGSPALNRRGLHLARRRIADQAGRLRRRRLHGLIPAADQEQFERDGIVVKPDFLDPPTFEAFFNEIMGLRAPAREAVIGDTLTRLIPLDDAALARMPTVKRVLEGPSYRALLTYVGSFRRKPHLYIQTVFSQHVDGPPDVQSFYHSDTFHPTLKAWFYLQDVADDEAPLAYVPGSHRANRRRLTLERRLSQEAHQSGDRLTAEGSFRFTEEDLVRLGYPPVRRLAVRANTLVVADTSGIHRRSPTDKASVRVSIWAYSRANPFLPWTGGDLVGLPGVKKHALRLYWAVKDRFKSRLPWGWVGERTPLQEPVPAPGPAAE